MPSGSRRRTPGLRREEVAALAGVGLTVHGWNKAGKSMRRWHFWKTARVLQLDAAGRYHLFYWRISARRYRSAISGAVSPLVRRLLDDLPLRPAYVMNLSWDIIARNPAARRLFAIDERPAQERNMLWMLFADPQLNERLLEWEAQAPQIWPASAATTPARRRMR